MEVSFDSNLTPGCLTLLKILEILKIYWNYFFLLEIYWKFTVCWKFSGLVCAFVVNISYNSCITECISTKYLAVNSDQLILSLVISVSVS